MNNNEIASLEQMLAESPDSPALLASLGENYLVVERAAEAIPCFERAISLGLASGRIYLCLGLAYALVGDVPTAVGALLNVTDSDGDLDVSVASSVEDRLVGMAVEIINGTLDSLNNPLNISQAAATLMVLNRFADALEIFDGLKEQSGVLPKLMLWRGLALLKLADNRGAYFSLRQYTSDCPDDAFGFYLLGLSLFGLREVAQATGAYMQALQLRPGHMKAGLRLAQANMIAENFPKAEMLLRSLLNAHPECVEAYFGLGKCLEKLLRPDEAVECMAKGADLAPDILDYQLSVGLAFMKLERSELALKYLRRASQLAPHDGDVAYRLGLVLGSLEQFQEAAAELEKAVKANPRSSRAYYGLGGAYASLGQFEKAISAFENALKLDPRAVEAHYELGVTYYRMGNHGQAFKELSEFAVKVPSDSRPLYYMALCDRSLRKVEESCQEFLKVIDANVDPKQQAYAFSAQSLQQNNYSVALKQLNQASVNDSPDSGGEFFASALLQFFAYKAISNGRALQEEHEYSVNIEDSLFQFMVNLAAITDLRDAYCQSHSQRVAVVADILAQAMQVGSELGNGIHVGACLHDAGKMALPDAAMYRSDGDDEESRNFNSLYEQHPRLGADHFASMPFPEGVVEAIGSHHERWDGSGFPEGLEGKAIPLAAQIVGLADYVERLLSNGREGRPCSWEETVEDVGTRAGSLFNPDLVKCFMEQSATIQEKLQSFQPQQGS